MNINDVIHLRRAIYPSQFEEGEIKNSLIECLLENANTAPSHKLTQPWFFKVFKGNSKDTLANEMVKSFQKFSPNINFIELKKKKIIEKCLQSNCIICVFMKEDSNNTVPKWEEISATAMAVQNMWLTCAANNIGCYWSTPKYCERMHDFFNLKKGEKSLGFFYLGKFNHSKVKAKKRISVHDKTEWNY